MTVTETLQQVIDSNPMFHGRGEGLLPVEMMAPFRIGEWLVCTDGHAIAAVVSDEAAPEQTKKGIRLLCEDWLKRPLGDATLPLKDLMALIPAPKDEPPCGICGDRGYINCAICHGEGIHNDKPCKSCDDGENDCPEGCERSSIEPVVIGSLVYDARILRRFLTVASGEEFRFIESDVNPAYLGSQGEPLVAGGETWRVIIMPTRWPVIGDMPRLLLEAKSEAPAL